MVGRCAFLAPAREPLPQRAAQSRPRAEPPLQPALDVHEFAVQQPPARIYDQAQEERDVAPLGKSVRDAWCGQGEASRADVIPTVLASGREPRLSIG